MTASSILRSPFFAAAIFAAVVFGGTPWLVYSIGLWAAGGLPEPPKTIAPADAQREVWGTLLGVGEPSLDPLTPYTYLAKLENPGEERPGLLASYTVASDHLLAHRRFEGRQWWSLSNASLVIWLSRNWTIEQILSKLIEMRSSRQSTPAEAPR